MNLTDFINSVKLLVMNNQRINDVGEIKYTEYVFDVFNKMRCTVFERHS